MADKKQEMEIWSWNEAFPGFDIQGETGIPKQELEKMEGMYNDFAISFIPSSANFITLIFDSKESSISFYNVMLNKGIILRHLEGWGYPRCVRITIGTEEENKYLISYLSEVGDFISDLLNMYI